MFNLVLRFVLLGLVFSTGANAATSDSNYKLGAGDTIKISVYGEEDLSFDELIIDGSESFDYPYLGDVSTKDLSLKQVQKKIADGLTGDYLLAPKVNVSIVTYRNFYVNGVVNKPGAYEYQPGLTVEKAIALAGGFLAKYRKSKGIYVTDYKSIEGLSEKALDKKLEKQGEAKLTDKVNPGDAVYVVSSFW